MTAKEALKTKYTGSDEKGNLLLAYTPEQLDVIKQALTSYEELVRDVKRYFELTYRGKWDNDLNDKEKWELAVLKGKLMKVGKEE